jgi:uncharacterized FAD-dependent dehydrogenase
MRWRIANVWREVGEDPDVLVARAADRLGVDPTDIAETSVIKRSIDARGRRAPRFVHLLEVTVPADAVDPDAPPAGVSTPRVPSPMRPRSLGADAARPVVIGMGPCGLFAAMQLAEAGLRPIVIDRGRPVETRAKDVARLMGRGEINAESNLCYGEGGAGTWSDGKLYTRVGGEHVLTILQQLVQLGAPDRILVDGRPHLGTDRLVALLKAFRAALMDRGCDLRFETRVDRLMLNDGRVTGVALSDGTIIDATHVVLAVGHSARTMYRHLAECGVAMERKPFAAGFRVEHPQALINEIQYGSWAGHDELPAAYYELSANLGTGPRRTGVYSFCMCPGGSVVPTPTREGEVCVNGMSHAARSGRYANSALVVQVEADQFGAAAANDPHGDLLAGVTWQQRAERVAWDLGGGAFVAPAQRLTDFLAGRVSSEIRRTTYKRGVASADLTQCYPAPLIDALREAVRRFDRRMPGYLTDEAVLIGVETRTSAPVTVLRDRETLQSPSTAGLYPAGEGAGYGGGIVSAAIDGLRVANRVLDEVEARAN